MDVVEQVLSYPKLYERIKGKPKDRERAVKLINDMKADFSPSIVKSIGRLIDMTFARLYDDLNFELPSNIDLKKLCNENCVVLVPNHQSHADYIALTYLFWTRYKLPVFVAGGVNLNIFPIGPFFRKSGCFFIRRSFHNDILYKFCLEAYVHYLLQTGKIIEFFFEGGRSRTGKLLSPRFGLFQMIIEAHSQLYQQKPLLFLPVSIVHEYVPEQRSHVRELEGARKKKESTRQLLRLYKLFNKKFGTIHIKMNDPIPYTQNPDLTLKEQTHDMAFLCFRAVGKGMPVIPSSLLSLVILDEPTGAITWDNIARKSRSIINFSKRFSIPLTPSLAGENWEDSLRHALELLLSNKKVQMIQNEKLGRIFYAIKEESRSELLYFKNTILHHFIVPGLVASSWIKIFNGTIGSAGELRRYLLEQRKQLKYEFYLPTVKELYNFGLEVVSYGVNREISDLKECFHLSHHEFYALGLKIGVFSRAFAYIFEAYYIACLGFKHLSAEDFTREKFLQITKEIYELEKVHGRFIKYSESYSVPLMINALKYFENLKLIEKEKGRYSIDSLESIESQIDKLARHLTDLLTFSRGPDISPIEVENGKDKHSRY